MAMNEPERDGERRSVCRIRFRALDRLDGEAKSKLLRTDSRLHKVLTELKRAIRDRHATNSDRMDLHIELLDARDDALLRTRAEILEGQTVDLLDESRWGYTGPAFVLRVPDVDGMTGRHITVVYFGKHSRPPLPVLLSIVRDVVQAAGI